MGHGWRHGGAGNGHLAAERRLGGRGGLERHVRDIHLGQGAEQQLGAQVRGGAVAGRGIGHLAAAGQRQQLGQVVGFHVRVHVQQVGRDARHRHGLQIAQRVIARVGEQRWVHRVGHAVHQQRVAVCRRVHHLLRGDVAARTRPVLDDHVLAHLRREQRAQQARHDVGGAARGEGDHDADRLVGPCGVGHAAPGKGCGQQADQPGLHHKRAPVRCARVLRGDRVANAAS